MDTRETDRKCQYSQRRAQKTEGELCCTHRCMCRAVVVACMRGERVVLLLVRYVMLQTRTSIRGSAPGPLTTTTTSSGPGGAEVWGYGRLAAVVTSHCCTGLQGRKWEKKETGGLWEREDKEEVSVGERKREK